jgi:NifU-like protein
LVVRDGVVRHARAKTFGCAAAIASSSALTELILGKPLDEVRSLRNTDVVDFLGGLPEQKVVCSVGAEQVLKEALA